MLGSLGFNAENKMENKKDSRGDSGGPNDAERMYKFRFFVNRPSNNTVSPGDPITHRIMFITDVPYNLYEHSMWEFKATNDFNAICLKKNNMKEECPACSAAEKMKYPFFNGLMQIIDMGQVEYENGNVSNLHHYSKVYKNEDTGEEEEKFFRFSKKMISLQIGTKDRPKRFQKFASTLERRGHGAIGTVWDVTRNGEKGEQVGDEWTFVGRLEPKGGQTVEDCMVRYLKKYGATDDEIDVTPLPWDGKGGVFNIPSVDEYYDKMCEMVGWSTGKSQEETTVDGADFGGNSAGFEDDDIPF